VTSFRSRLALSLSGFVTVIAVSAGLAQGPQLGRPSTAQQQSPLPVQGPTPTFKSEVNYVEVDAIVTDSAGTFIRDLSKDDFQVFEDRKLQTITTCERVDIPVERAVRPLFATQPIEPDVKSNEHPFDGRIYVMVIDDLHTAFGRGERVRRTARQFIEQRLGANDLMAVVTTGGRAEANREFTTNRQLLLSAVDSVNGRRLVSATGNKLDAYRTQRDLRLPGEPIADPEEPVRADEARSTLRTLRSVANWLSRIHGRRKSILFVSEGLEYDIFNQASSSLSAASSNTRAIYDEMRETISAAARADVSIYGIDPRGLATAGDEDIEIESYPTDPSLGIRPTSLMDELRISQDSLRVLSDETGGFAVVNRNDVGSAYDRIVQDNSSYYVLAYYPPSDARDGRSHTIDVRVRRPGLTVRARKSYVAPERQTELAVNPTGGASRELRELLESPLPVSGLGLRVFGAPFKGNPPNASVLFSAEMRGSDLQLGPKDVIELAYMAVDPEGKVRGSSTDTVTMNLRPEVKEQIAGSGLRFTKRLNLAPGRYQVRVAGRDSSSGALGLVLYDLDVPDFNGSRLSMSGLVLTSREAQALPTTKPDDELKGVLPGPPTAIREFSPSDEIVLFAEVYDNEASKSHRVDITTTVRTTEGAIVFKESEERDASELQGPHGGYDHTARIPLRGFAPGLYVLNVEGRSRLGPGLVASREIQFSVVRSEPLPPR
jgi:VWFA-related protein